MTKEVPTSSNDADGFECGMIRLASISELEAVISLIDNEFTKEGYGFVNKAQIETEIYRKSIYIAEIDGQIVGCRIGKDTVWNLVVSRSRRGLGIGRALINYKRPSQIRVKSDPIGHLSIKQRVGFVDPTGFYEKLGYRLWGNSLPRNFWQKGKDGKGQYHLKGTNPHIKIYKDAKRLLFE